MTHPQQQNTAVAAGSVDYRDLSAEEQVAALRPVALAAAHQFNLHLARLDLVAHAFNTTFRADTVDGRRYALRVNTNSQSTIEHVAAQQAWQCAIATDTDVRVPVPLATTGGDWYVQVDAESFGRPLIVTAASWLAGPDVADLDLPTARELGRTMALLHQHAESWSVPPGGALPRLDTPLFGDRNLLDSVPGLSADHRVILNRALDEADSVFANLYHSAPVRPLHADLHGGNLKCGNGRLSVFDFDDCGLGLPVLDLAVSVFYLRDGNPAREEVLLAGYEEMAPLPDVGRGHFDALLAARQLLLANSLLASTTAELRGEAGRYLDVAVARLRRWLERGNFTRALPGTMPTAW